MNTPITYMRIDAITVGDRLRNDLGDIDGLAESIREHGLLHPITVDDNGVLIAGGRRLEAMRRLDFEDVPVRLWQTLGDTDRRLIELEENLQRKDLTPYERSKNVAELAEVAEQVDRDSGEILTESVKNPKGGRPREIASGQRVADRIGIPRTTINEAKQHVSAAETSGLTFLQRPEWNQSKALEVARSLNALPEEDRPALAKLVSEPGTPPDRALSMIQNVAQKPPQERKEILHLAASADERERSLAKTRAAEKPPMPDPRRALLKDAMTAITKAIRLFPVDPEVPDLEAVNEQLSAIYESIKKERVNVSLNAAD